MPRTALQIYLAISPPYPFYQNHHLDLDLSICKAYYLSETSHVGSVSLGRTRLQNDGVIRVPFIICTRAEKGAVAAGNGVACRGAH